MLKKQQQQHLPYGGSSLPVALLRSLEVTQRSRDHLGLPLHGHGHDDDVSTLAASPHDHNTMGVLDAKATSGEGAGERARTGRHASSGFSFEGRGRRSPPRPTRALQWDGPVGATVRG